MQTPIATIRIDVPVLETARLTLREPRLSDLDAVLAFGRSKRSSYIGGPFEDWQIWTSLSATIGHWALRGYGMWTAEDKATGRVVGRIGLINHIDWPEPELGWQVFDGFEGKGLAHEGAMAARHHAQTALGMGPLISQIHADNLRSLALAERMGAVREATSTLRGVPCLIYRHPKDVA